MKLETVLVDNVQGWIYNCPLNDVYETTYGMLYDGVISVNRTNIFPMMGLLCFDLHCLLSNTGDLLLRKDFFK